MRVLLDTHIFIWYAKEQDKLSNNVLTILSDYENEVYVSSETLKEHYDPSDHLIISHALTNRLTLISADGKFPYYRNQGLDLIENK